MLTESSCTIYKFNGIGYDRFFVPHCHWQEDKASNVLKSGLQNADSVTMYIPLDSMYVAPQKHLYPSATLLPNAENVPKLATKDIIVKGECNFIFNNSSQQKASESLKKLREQYDYFTVMSIDRKLYGSKNLQHIKISAR